MAEAVPVWQVVSLISVLGGVHIASSISLTRRIRSLVQPWVLRQVERGTCTVLSVQRLQCQFLDVFLALVSWVVSVEFYTAFLPLLFWSGHCALARRMTFLMALCIYTGNCIKDLVSAPRPPSPPVKRLVAVKAEQEYALEFGLPSSHTINTICLSMYFLLYFSGQFGGEHGVLFWLVTCILFATIILVAFGRVYLGMHTPVDIVAGVLIGVFVLFLWCQVDEHVDNFVTKGENTLSFSTCMSLLLLLAYPRPEQPTPSFEYHTAFNGVVLGVVWGVHRTYWEFHNDNIPTLGLCSWAEASALITRFFVGFPIILLVKSLIKSMSKRSLPVLCKLFHLPIRSTQYVPSLHAGKIVSSLKEDNALDAQISIDSRSFWLKVLPLADEEYLDVDSGIRLLQYAALSWSVVEVVPYVYKYLGL